MTSNVYLTRIESFSASHRLHCKSLTDEQNVEMFGKCNNVNGHGHNYKMEVTVTGPVDPVTGMLINISELKKLIQDRIMDVLDHKNIDQDVEYFKDKVSSAENIARFIFEQLKIHNSFPNRVRLHSVKLYETEKNIVHIKDDWRENIDSVGWSLARDF